MVTYRDFDDGRALRDFFRNFHDFQAYTATDWVITTVELGAGAATRALAPAAAGGLLVLTNDAADNDYQTLQWAGNTGAVNRAYKHATGKALQFVARFKVLDALRSDLMLGLWVANTNPIAGVTDGIFFRKDDNSRLLKLVVRKGGVETVVDLNTSLANDTYYSVEFYYDGSNARYGALVNGNRVGAAPLTNAPDTQELALSMAIQNGLAVINVMTLDFFGAEQQR